MYKTIDLFAGIGGIRRGFELTKMFENVFTAENDIWACKTYNILFNENNRCIDVTSSNFINLLHDIDYDVLLAGFPCQSFSLLGSKLGFKDITRGTLFHSIAELLRSYTPKSRPKAIFLENVENLLFHDEQKTIHTIFDILIKELDYKIIGVESKNGYYEFSTKTIVRNSCDFGVPQNRKRAYLLCLNHAFFGDQVYSLPAMLPEKGNKIIYNSINDILDKQHVAPRYYLSSCYLETLKKHKIRQKYNGNNFGYRVINPIGEKPKLAGAVLATGGAGRERNIIYDPVEEYKGLNIKGKHSPLNSDGLRFMTPIEWARLQGFAGYAFICNNIDYFQFPDKTPNTQKYKQLGNSVTIPVIETLANFLIKCFKKLNF